MRILSTILILIILPFIIKAEEPERPQEDILRPAALHSSWGVFLGGNLAQSSGSLLTTCDCEYESGDGFNVVGGVYYRLALAGELSLVGQLMYEGMNASYTDTEIRPEYVLPSGSIEDIEFEKNTDVSLAYMNVDALLRYSPSGGALYLLAGPSFGILINDNITENEKILSSGYQFSDSGNDTKDYLDGSIEQLYELQKIRIALRAGIGYEIPVGPGMMLMPEASYSMPFTTIVTELDEWKHSAWQFVMRFNMTL
jgi:Outer membrane protein beta-barrel domain